MGLPAHAAAAAPVAHPRPTALRSVAPVAGLLLAGAAISGFTILRGGAPFDEGLVLQAARRVSDGQVPYRDFLWPYGPAQPYAFGASFELFGTSLLWWRLLRVACDAAVAACVYVLARRVASRRLALAGWLAAACAMAQPTSATPFPPALLLGLLALAVAGGGARPRRLVRPLAGGLSQPDARPPRSVFARPLAAGVLCGLAAAWRLDFGIYAGGAILVTLSLRRSGPRDLVLRQLGAFTAAAVTVAGLVYLPFMIAVGPADLYDALLGSSLRERGYWTLPFPLAYEGRLALWPPGTLAEDAKDVLGFYLPALLVTGLALVVGASALRLRVVGRGAAWPIAELVVLAVGGLLYLLSRSDELHTTPLLVALAAALPIALAWRPPRALAAALALVLALLVVHGVANRLSALLLSPELARIDVPVADGAQAPPREAAAIERMVAAVDRRVPPGGNIYTITRRSDLVRFNQPLVWVLTDRDNPTDRDFGLLATPAAQRQTVAALERSRPTAIVRWTDPISVEREPNLRGRPSGSRLLDRYVAEHFRPAERAGPYEVLVLR